MINAINRQLTRSALAVVHTTILLVREQQDDVSAIGLYFLIGLLDIPVRVFEC